VKTPLHKTYPVVLVVAAVLFCGAAACRGQSPATPNFIGAEAAYLERAEECRQQLGVFWADKALPNWSSPCPVQVTEREPDDSDRSGGGVTSMHFDRGEVFGWSMRVEGTRRQLLEEVIPHEVCHTIVASLARRPIPRWLDEGVSTLFESEDVHRTMRQHARGAVASPGCAWRLLNATEYPANLDHVMDLYATSFTVVEWLMEIGGREKLLQLLMAEGPCSEILPRIYGLSLSRMEQEWRTRLQEGSVSCEDHCCYVHGHGHQYFVSKYSPPPDGKPILYAVGTDSCYACLPYVNSYAWLPAFRNALNARATVVKVDANAYPQWVADRGVRCWPAFVLEVDGEYYVKHGFPGRHELIAWVDATIVQHRRQETPSQSSTPANPVIEPNPESAAIVREGVDEAYAEPPTGPPAERAVQDEPSESPEIYDPPIERVESREPSPEKATASAPVEEEPHPSLVSTVADAARTAITNWTLTELGIASTGWIGVAAAGGMFLWSRRRKRRSNRKPPVIAPPPPVTPCPPASPVCAPDNSRMQKSLDEIMRILAEREREREQDVIRSSAGGGSADAGKFQGDPITCSNSNENHRSPASAVPGRNTDELSQVVRLSRLEGHDPLLDAAFGLVVQDETSSLLGDNGTSDEVRRAIEDLLRRVRDRVDRMAPLSVTQAG